MTFDERLKWNIYVQDRLTCYSRYMSRSAHENATLLLNSDLASSFVSVRVETSVNPLKP